MTNNNKTSKKAPEGSLNAYRAWMNALREDTADLGSYGKYKDRKTGEVKHRRYTRMTFWAVCTLIASNGTNGFGCWMSDEEIAKRLGSTRQVIWQYRTRAIELGWFVDTGNRVGQFKGVPVLNIAIPTPVQATEKATEAKPRAHSPVPSPRPSTAISEAPEVDPWASQRRPDRYRRDGGTAKHDPNYSPLAFKCPRCTEMTDSRSFNKREVVESHIQDC